MSQTRIVCDRCDFPTHMCACLPEKKPALKFSELFGLLPDFTGRLTSEQWVHAGRGEIQHVYDQNVDMHYVYLHNNESVKQVETNAIVDIDRFGNIVGFEIFGIEQVSIEEPTTSQEVTK